MTNAFDLLREVDVPEGEQGSVRVEKFTVDRAGAEWSMLSSALRGGMSVDEGTYTRLMVNGRLMMSDTLQERREHATFVRKAEGRVLIAGLGIGMVLQAVADKENVSEVHVVEINKDVCDLVWPTYKERYGNKVHLHNRDIYDCKDLAKEEWDAVWFDIWPDKCTDNLKEMTKLKRMFSPKRCRWRGFWVEEELRYHREREKRMGW